MISPLLENVSVVIFSMNNRTYIINLPLLGSAWVSVGYFQNFPIYFIRSLESNEDEVILFASVDGRWQQDGGGVTLKSETIGKAIEENALK